MKYHLRNGTGPMCFCRGLVVLTRHHDAVTCQRCLRSMEQSDALAGVFGLSDGLRCVWRTIDARRVGLATADDINWFGE